MNPSILGIALFIVLGPLVGGVLEGLSRKISARLQGRVGPPVLQPFYDVVKLFSKTSAMESRAQSAGIATFLVFTACAGSVFFSGGDMLVFFFALTLANVFLVLSAYAGASPFSHAGAERELILIMAYEPMLILVLAGMYVIAGSFRSEVILASRLPMIVYLPGCFLGMIMVIVVKLQKSPFDISASHHPHQELVRGLTTDFSGATFAMYEIAHWYKYSYLTAFIALFFGFNPIASAIAIPLVFFLVVVIDNAFARLTFRTSLAIMWITSFVLGFGNVFVLYVLKHFTPFLQLGVTP